MRPTTAQGRLLVLAAVLCGPLVCPPGSHAQAGAPIIVVFNIEDKGVGMSRPIRERLSDYLAMSLAATGAYQVVPRDQLKKHIFQKKKESYKHCYAKSCQIAIGRELAAQKSLATMVVKLGSRCMVTSVLYDLRKSASEGGATVQGKCDEDGIVSSLQEVVRELASSHTSRRPPDKPEPKPAPEPAGLIPERPPEPAVERATVDINSSPEGAEVSIDDVVKGSTPLRLQLEKGKSFAILIAKEGYKPVKRQLIVERRTRINVELEMARERIERLITKTEWFALRANGGNYGGGGYVSFFTLRWKNFYWEILRGGGGAGGTGWYGMFGTALGFPLHIGQKGKHELRFGAGIMAGEIWYNRDDSPLAFCPEAYYVWHQSEYFALQAGIDLSIAFFAVYGDVPAPVFNVFFGFRI